MNTKLDLYAELESAMNKSGVDYDRDESQYMVVVHDGSDTYAYVEVYKDYYIGGVCVYDNSDNSYNFSNVGCPDFYNVEEAVDWLVNR